MKDWQDDKKWSDKYLLEIKAILGQTFLSPAPFEEDVEHNTDLIVLRMNPIRVACRLRRIEYYAQYSNEFTIRTSRPSGNKTELAKIIEGWGDYFFYGFCDNDNVVSWKIYDLKFFRLWFVSYLIRNRGIKPGIEKKNHDNSSSFRVFQWNQLPQEGIIAASVGGGVAAVGRG